MLGFLGDIAGAAKNFMPVASGIGSILDAFGIGARPKLNYGPTASEQQAQSLLLALQDPNNSLVQANTQTNLQRGMQDFLMQLKQMQMLDARRNARGLRGTFYSPERADETLDYLTSRGLPMIADKARTTARSDIEQQINALQGQVPAERTRMNAVNNERISRSEMFSAGGGFGGLTDKLGQGIEQFLQQMNMMPWERGVQAGTLKRNPYSVSY